ncbi:MAG: DASH family cryptochrome [Flavobacteriales bacterium]|nr:DASH family cryptochrome [Flavobacteriales bacterium]
MNSIYWFRNDLRLEDNPALVAAIERGEPMVPVYVFDDLWWTKDAWGIQKTGAYRTAFLLESVADLQQQLQAIGVELIILKGASKEVLTELAISYECDMVFAQKEHTPEEIQLEHKVASIHGVTCQWVEGHTLVHPEQLPFALADLPDMFTQFRKKVEKQVEYQAPLEKVSSLTTPEIEPSSLPELADFGLELPASDPRGVMVFKGGSKEAWSRLNYYFWESKKLSFYKKTRNGLLGEGYSSKFSPWLTNGSISSRSIVHQVKEYEQEHGSNQSTYWLIFELLWRDYFRFVAMKYGNQLFLKNGLKASAPQWSQDKELLNKWIEGKTADSFVNANMHELRRTGWMSNRGRQNVASYLVHDLGIDWRLGAAVFEHFLIDYDPTANYGNWAYVAGVGNDPRPNRKFNTQKQASMYDAQGKYQQKWNNELLEFDV